MKLTKSAQNTVLRLQIELTKSVTYIYGKAKLTWFEEIFEEYYQLASWSLCSFHSLINHLIDCSTYCLQNLGKGFLRYISHINTRELVILDSVDTKSIQSRVVPVLGQYQGG